MPRIQRVLHIQIAATILANVGVIYWNIRACIETGKLAMGEYAIGESVVVLFFSPVLALGIIYALFNLKKYKKESVSQIALTALVFLPMLYRAIIH